MADNRRAICVSVGDSRKIFNNLYWNTTAEHVIRQLRPKQGPYVLLESWNGCARVIGKDEYICQILEDWGEDARNVQLVLMSARNYAGYRERSGLLRAKIYAAQTHGKVASNRRRCVTRLPAPKRKVIPDIQRLIGTTRANRERLSELQTAINKSKTKVLVTEDKLSPLEEEWVGIKEAIEEERREQEGLVQRREDVKVVIEKKKAEMEELKKTNAELQAKVGLGKEKLDRLKKAKGSKEAEVAQAEIEKLQNELKVRMKLNQLQSAKAEELAASISKADQDTLECASEIDSLKSLQ